MIYKSKETMQSSPKIMNNIHSFCAKVLKQIILNIMTCGMLSNYFMAGSLCNPKDKSNHVWEYVIFIVCNVKYVNCLY